MKMTSLIAAAAMAVLPAFAFPQAPGTTQSAAPTAPKATAVVPLPHWSRGRMMMRNRFETLTKVKADLEEAQGAAQAKGDQTAADKIGDALKLLNRFPQRTPERPFNGIPALRRRADMRLRRQHLQAMTQKMNGVPGNKLMAGAAPMRSYLQNTRPYLPWY